MIYFTEVCPPYNSHFRFLLLFAETAEFKAKLGCLVRAASFCSGINWGGYTCAYHEQMCYKWDLLGPGLVALHCVLHFSCLFLITYSETWRENPAFWQILSADYFHKLLQRRPPGLACRWRLSSPVVDWMPGSGVLTYAYKGRCWQIHLGQEKMLTFWRLTEKTVKEQPWRVQFPLKTACSFLSLSFFCKITTFACDLREVHCCNCASQDSWVFCSRWSISFVLVCHLKQLCLKQKPSTAVPVF